MTTRSLTLKCSEPTCHKPIFPNQACLTTSCQYNKHLDCVEVATQIKALGKASGAYVCMKNPSPHHIGKIEFAEMQPVTRLHYLQARINNSPQWNAQKAMAEKTLQELEQQIKDSSQRTGLSLSSFLSPLKEVDESQISEQEETEDNSNDSGFLSPTFSSSQRAASFTAAKDEEPDNEVFRSELHTVASLQVSSEVTSPSANTASSITEIMAEIEQLTASLSDEENPPSITQAEKANTAVEHYLAEANKPQSKKDLISTLAIEIPARGKILELAEQRTEEPHNNLLYLISLVAHKDTPKNAILEIQNYLTKFNSQFETSLENYTYSHGEDYSEALQELRGNLDLLIAIRIAAQTDA